MTTDKEKYVCMNCFAIGELSASLRCGSCDSDSVVSCEQVQQMTPKAESRQVRRISSSQQRPWYHFKCGPFETVVSYTKALSEEEALRYATGPNCEWYLAEALSNYDGLPIVVSSVLDHSSYIKWCQKIWPLVGISSEESTV